VCDFVLSDQKQTGSSNQELELAYCTSHPSSLAITELLMYRQKITNLAV